MNPFLKRLSQYAFVVGVTLLLAFSQKDNCARSAELYIIPRNIPFRCFDDPTRNFGWYHSIKVPYDKRSYKVMFKRDSIYEQYHTIVPFPEDLVLFEREMPLDSVYSTRMMMVLRCDGIADTVYMDSEYTLTKGNKYYKASVPFRKWLERQMPGDLYDSWSNNQPVISRQYGEGGYEGNNFD